MTRRQNQQEQNNKTVETKISKCDNLSGGQYTATTQLSRYRDEDSYKGGNLLYFSIKNKTHDREVAFYTNGSLSYDASDQNILSVIKDLEHSCDKNLEDPKDWSPTPRDDIAGKKYDPNHPSNIRDHPWYTEKATSQKFEPSIDYKKYLQNQKQKQLLDRKKQNAQDITESKRPGHFTLTPRSQTNDTFTEITRKRSGSHLNRELEKAKEEQKQRDPGHTPDRKHDRSR